MKRLDVMNKIGSTRIGMSYEDYCATYQRPAFGGRPLDVIDMQNRIEARADKTVLATEMKVAAESSQGWAAGAGGAGGWLRYMSMKNRARQVANKSRKGHE